MDFGLFGIFAIGLQKALFKKGTRMKPHKHAEVIKALADGAEIQMYEPNSKCWLNDKNPNWFNHAEYRIKPLEVPQWRKDMAQALKDGKEVQAHLNSGWVKTLMSAEGFLDASVVFYESEYRIKPEPKPDVVEFYVKIPGDELRLQGADFEWVSENGKKCPQLKVIWDGETGKLKNAEVLK